MADAGIKKVIIKKDNLPPVGPNNNFMIKYRIISEDKNRTSHWSPKYNLIAQTPTQVQGAIDVTPKSINVVWLPPQESLDKEAYDIFVKFDNGEYLYYGTSYNHSFSILNSGGTTVSIAVQLEGYIKERNNLLTIYQDTESLV